MFLLLQSKLYDTLENDRLPLQTLISSIESLSIQNLCSLIKNLQNINNATKMHIQPLNT